MRSSHSYSKAKCQELSNERWELIQYDEPTYSDHSITLKYAAHTPLKNVWLWEPISRKYLKKKIGKIKDKRVRCDRPFVWVRETGAGWGKYFSGLPTANFSTPSLAATSLAIARSCPSVLRSRCEQFKCNRNKIFNDSQSSGWIRLERWSLYCETWDFSFTSVWKLTNLALIRCVLAVQA